MSEQEEASTPSDETGAALKRIEERLVDIEAAMGRLDEGSYTRCERCGGALAPEDLEADPLLRLCAGCSGGRAG